MYSKEFMKFLYGYQKDDFKPKEIPPKEIHFTNSGSGTLAEATIVIVNNK